MENFILLRKGQSDNMTNYEKIKSMSVEEMSDLLDDIEMDMPYIEDKKQWLESECDE